MVSGRETLHISQSSPRCLGVVSGFLLKMTRESLGFTQAHLATRLGVDVASVQGWETGRRPLAAMRTIDLTRLCFQLLGWGVHPTLLDALRDALHADLIITDAVRSGDQLVETDWHPLGARVHQRTLSDMITWPFTGITPPALHALVTVRTRRGPARIHPTLTAQERTRFFDHLLVTANTHHSTPLTRRQAIYLLGFDTRTSTVEWLHTTQLHALRHAKHHDSVPSWIVVRSSAVALAYTGDRDPLRAYLHHTLTSDHSEQANLNYWAHWTGEINHTQTNDDFMNRLDPHTWNGVHLLGHLLEILHPGSPHAELNIHTVWTLLLTHPTLLPNHPHLRTATTTTIEQLATDHDLNTHARHELSDIAYATRLAHQ